MSALRDGFKEGVGQLKESAKNGPSALRNFLKDPRKQMAAAATQTRAVSNAYRVAVMETWPFAVSMPS